LAMLTMCRSIRLSCRRRSGLSFTDRNLTVQAMFITNAIGSSANNSIKSQGLALKNSVNS
jgi:hypothetical protein